MPLPFINLEEDERVEETLTDPELTEYTIKVPPTLVQKAKPTSLKNYVVHKRDPLHPNIPYPSRMHQEKQQKKDEVQIQKFWQMFKQLHINISFADALILIPKCNTPKLGRSGIWVRGVLLHESTTQDSTWRFGISLPSHSPTIDTPHTYSSWTKSSSSSTLTSLEESDLIWEEFEAYLASDSFPLGSDDTDFDLEGDLRLIEELLNNDPFYSSPSFSNPLSRASSLLLSPFAEEFADELALITFPPKIDDFLLIFKSILITILLDTISRVVHEEDKIKESKLLIDELDPPRSSDFLPSPKCDSVLYEEFSEVNALPSTNNEDKVFNPGILIHDNLFEVTIRVTPNKNVKKLSSSNASLILAGF
ncbi:hypothetical protein Tco_0952806 [Tanacetum coccineum]|uniref:Reverse transcriptase domain-containing protein n=1 Tax=Tanacetum coccineum TaxID=301880 RepID=A0ABQ5DY12_9ASTR